MFIRRNGALVGGIILTAIVFLLARPVLENDRGSYVPAVLQADHIGTAIAVLLLCLAVATGIGIVVTRLTNVCVAMFVMGAGLYALVHRLASIDEVLLAGSLTAVALESALWFPLVLGVVCALFRFGGPLHDVHPDEDGRRPSPFTSPEALKAAAAGVLVLPAVWFLGVSELTGQTVGAVFVGSLLAGLIGRLVSPHVQPILLLASPMFFAAIGVIIGVVAARGSQEELFVLRNMPAFLWPAPLEYACGSLAGVAMGYGWARSFLHHEDDELEEEQVARSVAAAD